MSVVALHIGRGADGERAARLAEHLGVPLVVGPVGDLSGESDALALVLDDRGLSLTDGSLEMRGDLSRMAARLTPANLSRELLVRAARVRGVDRPTAVDATAGLGEDSLMLAAAGFEVTLMESNPVIFALLDDALGRAALLPELAGPVARMHAVEGDSIEALPKLGFSPDVVYLDPMFPERHKSAAVKKKFQLLHKLEHPCDDPEGLLAAARGAHPRKVVVKRPAKGPALAGAKPSHSLAGKAIRYDVLV